MVIDADMLQMLRNLEPPEGSPLSFRDRLGVYMTSLSESLKHAQQSLRLEDFQKLEEAALKLSHLALNLGAVNMLRGSFDLQNLARCGALADAKDLMRQLEHEFLRVQQGLDEVPL